jgi:flagella basal body P-ring formation protein FlgA
MKNARVPLAIYVIAALGAAALYTPTHAQRMNDRGEPAAQTHDRGESAAKAAARQEPQAIQRAVENYLRKETAGLPGTVTFSVGAIDARSVLPACGALEVFTPTGARLWGATSLGVRCGGATPWNIYVTAHVKVAGDYAVSARPLAQGQMLTPSDIAMQSGDLTQLPAGVLTDVKQAVGKTSLAALAPGQPLRQDLLRSPLVIQQGQTVVVNSSGRGFRVSADGRALNNAYDGQIAQVRTASGQTLSGVARAGGVVEIGF